jgi:hypothetical protein
MQVDHFFTFSTLPGQTVKVTYWTNDWGDYNGFQVAPSLNQGFNSGVVSITGVTATMPVSEPYNAALFYTIVVSNEGGVITMVDLYNAWQAAL